MIRLVGLVNLQPPAPIEAPITEDDRLGDTTPSPEAGVNDETGRAPKSDMFAIQQQSSELYNMMNDNENLEGWAQEKITQAADFIASVYNHMKYEKSKANSVGNGDGSPADATSSTPNKPEITAESVTLGWEETVESMKKTNPSFLSEWMEKQGYVPKAK